MLSCQQLRQSSEPICSAHAGGGASDPVDPGTPTQRPNILCLTAEDHNPFLGAYGDPVAKTPNLDQLAKEGILYRYFYSTAPVCAPTRFGLITGVEADSCGPAEHMRSTVAALPAFIKGLSEYLREAGYYCTNSDKTDYNANENDPSGSLNPKNIWDDSSATAHYKNRPEDVPFFSIFNTMATHETFMMPSMGAYLSPLADPVLPENVRVPAYLPDTPEIRNDIALCYNNIQRGDIDIGKKLDELDQSGLADDTIVIYYSDNGGLLPRGKRHLSNEGVQCALIVRVPEKWKHFLPPALTRVGGEDDKPVVTIDIPPTILSLAGVSIPSYMHGKPFLGETISRRKFGFSARNRMDERYEMIRGVTDGKYRYIRNYMPHRIYGLHNAYPWQTKGYQSWETEHLAGKLNAAQDRFWNEKSFEEFYDLSTDRDQISNLIVSSEHQTIINEMREALDEHMLEINDNGFIPEGSTLQGWDASRATGAYPLQRIMDLAAVAAQRNPASLSILRDLTRDPNEIIRHWAAQGLLMLGAWSAPARNELETLRNDPAVSNQIVACEALGNINPAALDQLVDILESTSVAATFRLQALEALTYVGLDAVKPLRARIYEVITEIEVQSIDGFVTTDFTNYLVRAGAYLILLMYDKYQPSLNLASNNAATINLIKTQVPNP